MEIWLEYQFEIGLSLFVISFIVLCIVALWVCFGGDDNDRLDKK